MPYHNDTASFAFFNSEGSKQKMFGASSWRVDTFKESCEDPLQINGKRQEKQAPRTCRQVKSSLDFLVTLHVWS